MTCTHVLHTPQPGPAACPASSLLLLEQRLCQHRHYQWQRRQQRQRHQHAIKGDGRSVPQAATCRPSIQTIWHAWVALAEVGEDGAVCLQPWQGPISQCMNGVLDAAQVLRRGLKLGTRHSDAAKLDKQWQVTTVGTQRCFTCAQARTGHHTPRTRVASVPRAC